MAHNNDWFEGRSWSLFHADEEAHERCFRWRVGFLLYAAIAAGLILLPLLTGCASVRPEGMVCVLGQTEDGRAVVATQCVTPEAFAESQK